MATKKEKNMTDNEEVEGLDQKPNKPECFEGKRDMLLVNTWMYKIEQYLALTQLRKPSLTLTDANKISFASSFFTSTAAVSWFTTVQNGNIPTTWRDFTAWIRAEFVPSDHLHQARDKLRKLKQITSVSRYLDEFRNIVLTIPNMSDGEQLDRFVNGLKMETKIEVLKSSATTLSEAAKTALRIDSVIWGARVHEKSNASGNENESNPDPMDIGNVNTSQRAKDLANNACFRCHKKGFRPWKCHPQKKDRADASNVNIEDESVAF